MKNILEATWEDFYENSELLMEDSPKAKRLRKIYAAANEAYMKEMGDEEWSAHEDIINKYSSYYEQCVQDAFRYGFELGLCVMQKAHRSTAKSEPSPTK